MSSNKTIKALREERTLLRAEVRRLQEAAAFTISIPELDLSEHMARLRLTMSRSCPTRLIEVVDRVAETLPPMLLGYGSREEMQASREAIRPYQWDIYRELAGDPTAFARHFLGEFRVSALDWTLAPPDATHALEKYRDNVVWLKLGRGREPAYRWSTVRWDWVQSFRDSAQALESEHVTARPAPKEKWSLNGQNGAWDYDSLAELIRDNYGHTRDSAGPMGCDSDLVEGSTVYRAIECKDDPAGFLPGTDDVLEHMSERAYDSDAGEWADNYPEVDDVAKSELDKALEPLQAWARKHCQPDFFTVKGIAPHILTEDDVRAALALEVSQ